MDFSRDLNGMGDLSAFNIGIFRKMGGIALNKETTTLLQAAFRDSGKVIHADVRIWPNGGRSEGTLVGSPEQQQGTPNSFEHVALERQPGLTESCGIRCLGELLPKILTRIGTSALHRFVSCKR